MTIEADPRIDNHYQLTEDQKTQFREDGFIKLKDVFSQDVLDDYGETITRLTLAEAPETPIDQRDTYGKAFIQVGGLWEKDAKAKQFTFSKRLARIATELLDTTGVRLYHSQALYKEPAGGFTPWHADQQYWPMASAKSVTAWIPLQKTPIEMGPLEFAKGSHLKNIGRDIAISDESETRIREMVKKEHLVSSYEPYDAGEVSFHLGWTLHRAGPNTTDLPRKVHTVIYMDEMMRMQEPRTPGQVRDANDWCAGTKVGEIIATERTPVIWSSKNG